MATICQPRRVLVEIPAPQPKIAARMRRSYLEILSSRSRDLSIASRRGQSVDTALPRRLRGGAQLEEPCARADESQSILSKQQLLQLIRSLILAEQTHTHPQRQRSQTPTSDLKLLQEDLQLKKTSVYRSIPYSRLGSNRDAHCYRKAYPHLVAFKLSCQEGGAALLSSEDWESAIEHSLVAWRYTSELPQWDTSSHNALREQCFVTLAAHCATALQHLRPQPARARELMRRLKVAQVHSQTILPCVQELKRILGES